MPIDKDPPDEIETEGNEGPRDGQDVSEETDLSAEQPDGEIDDGEPEGDEEAVDAKPSRAETRFQRLANEAKAAREEAAAARRETEELRRGQQSARQQQETQEQEAARLALMTPDERVEYKLDKAERRHQQQLQMLSFQQEDRADKMEFAAKAASNSVYAKYKDEVESRLTDLRAKGQNVSREALLKFVIGEQALNGAGSKKPAQAAKKRVDAQRVNPGSSRGDTASSRGRGEPSLEKRLENVPI